MRIQLTFCFILLFGVGINAQKIYRVNSVNDVDDGSCNDNHCSLREAIHAANGDGMPSILWFEINGPGTKVIALESALPAISAPNLTIEGNTLPNNMPTKGLLVIDGQGIIEHGFDIQSTDIRLYGLQLQNFVENAVLVASPTLDTINHITIGRMQRGNIFVKNGAAVNAQNINTLIFRGNYVGTNINFEEGLGNRNGIIVDNNWASYEDAVIRIGGSIQYEQQNYFANSSESAINISYQGSAKIEGNIFGTGINGTEKLGNTVAVRARNYRGRIDVGGSIDTKNTFAYNESAVIIDDNNFVRVSENSFYCNAQGLTVTNNAHPVPVIESGLETVLVGRSQPNDFVEVYLTDAPTCNSGDCQGMLYVGTVQANSSGEWEFSGQFEYGQQMVALSINNGRQSMFSECFRFCPGTLKPAITNTGPYCEEDTIQLQTEIDLQDFRWVTHFTPNDVAYEWTGPEEFIAFESNPNFKGKAGEYILQTYLFGCPTEPDTTTVIINNLKATIEPIAPACQADSLMLNSLITSNLDEVDFYWTGPENYQSTLKNPTNIKKTGTYQLTVAGEGCQAKAEIEVRNDFPVPFSLGETRKVCEGSAVVLSIDNYDFYQWSGGFDFPCDTCSSINFTPSKAGNLTLKAGSSASCYTTAALNIEVVELITNVEERILCPGTSLNLLNQTIRQAGEYTATFTTANGCDSTQTYLVTQPEENTIVETQTICAGESILQFGQNYTTSGIYQSQFTAANGCDSTHILELTVLEKSIVTETFSICEGETLSIFGQDIGQSTTITKNFTAANGCDSIHTISLLVKATYQDAQQLVLCAGETAEIFQGLVVSKSGYYQRDFVSSNGCDSVAIYEVEVLAPIETFHHITMCEEEAKDLFGETNAFPGDYAETFTSQSGCDSVHFTSFTINFGTTEEEFITICETDAYSLEGVEITQPGQYVHTYTRQNGCDSTHLTNVTILKPSYSFAEFDLCAGESMEVFGENIEEEGIYMETFTNQNGCDSFHTVTILMKAPKQTDEVRTICAGESILLFDKSISSAELVSQTFSASNGCDSTHTIRVEVLEKIQTDAVEVICETTCLAFYGAAICSDKVMQQTFTASSGCDSIHTLHLTITEPQSITEEFTLCHGDSLAAFGTFFKNAGTFTNNFMGKNGCDSTHTIVVNFVEPIAATVEVKSACAEQSDGEISLSIDGGLSPYTVNWEGNNQQSMTNLAAGDYQLSIKDYLGCTYEQNITIEAIPKPNIEKEILDISCFGEKDGSIALFSDVPVTYQIAGQTFKENEGGYYNLAAAEYELFMQDKNGCAYQETFSILEPDPMVVELPESITINLGESVKLEPNIIASSLVNYEWDKELAISCLDCQEPTVNPLKSTKYILTIYDDNNCESQAEVWVKINTDKGIYLPNVFSPNEDGRNDKFTILGTDSPVDKVDYFKVFDRWGTLLYEANNFQPNDESYGWDGTYRGQTMDNGVYLYFAVVKFIDGSEVQVQGDVTLAK